MKPCEECGSANNRITPLLHPEECLRQHTQYICGTCGRCICIEKEPKRGLQRWNFPFKTLEIARLYLRTADYTMKTCCTIYEISTATRISYKIFSDQKVLAAYQKKHPGCSCRPVYRQELYQEYPSTQIHKLTEDEIHEYLKQR